MRRHEKVEILKFFLTVFNAIFLILGLAFFGCGMWILFDQNIFVMINAEAQVKSVAFGLFTIGLVVVGISVLGYIGVAGEIRWSVILHVSLLIAILAGEISVTSMVLTNREKISGALMTDFDKIITVYGNKTASKLTEVKCQLLDTLQRYKKCCGRMNYTQWSGNLYISSFPERNVYPCSCFNASACPVFSNNGTLQRFGKGSAIYTQGCQQSIEDWLLENGIAILGLQLGMVLIQAIQLVLGLNFWRITQKEGQQVQPEEAFSANHTTCLSSVIRRPVK